MGKFMLGCGGLTCEGVLSAAPFIINVLLVIYMSAWFTSTFILTFSLSFYLARIIENLSCTDKFIK